MATPTAPIDAPFLAAPVQTPVATPVTTPIVAPVGVIPVLTPTAPTVTAPVAAPATIPVPTPLAAPIATPVGEPVIMPPMAVPIDIIAPVLVPVATPTAPIDAPFLAAPVETPVAAPATTPIVAPVVVVPVLTPTAPTVAAPSFAVVPIATPVGTPIRMPTSTSITAFYLIDARNSRRLNSLSNGDVVSLRDLNMTQAAFNLEVEPGSSVASVVFLENGRKESAKPLSYCGDTNGVFATCSNLVIGTHTITVRPYTGSKQSGTQLSDVAITFSIQLKSAAPVAAPVPTPVAIPVFVPSVPTPVEPVTVTLLNASSNKTFPILDSDSLAAMDSKESPFGVWYWAAYKPNKANKGIYPGLKGGSILCRWSDLELTPGVYDWSQVHEQMDAAIAEGLRYSFTLMVGPDTPEWAYQQGVPKVLTTESGWQFPYYLNNLYRQLFDTLVQEVVAHLKNLTPERANSLVEVRLNEGSTGDPFGYKGDVLKAYAQYDISDTEWDAFRRAHIQAVRNYIGDDGLSKINMSFTHVSDETEAFAASLFPDAQYFKNGMASHGYHIPEDESSVLNVQRSQAFNGDPKFGGTRIRWFGELDGEWLNGWFQKSPAESFWWSAIYALHMGLSRWLVQGEAMQVPAYHFALDFFNKHGEHIDAATSPYAFCALRDGLDASDTNRFNESQYGTTDDKRPRLGNILDDFQDYGAVVEDFTVTGATSLAFRGRKGYVDVLYGGVRGNYHRFLYQVNPPAESIGWWHVGSNDWPYGRFARSFHSSSGRTAMYFRLDDRFISDKNAPQAVAVSVTYYDEGNGTWEVIYNDSFLGVRTAVTITCGDTPTWKKVRLDLAHAKLDGSLDNGADLILHHVSGSDTKFHMIELDRAEGVFQL